MMDTPRRPCGQATRPGEAVVVGAGIGEKLCVCLLAPLAGVEPGLQCRKR
jgi:hypothetical protein